jgi:Trp operon repressor
MQRYNFLESKDIYDALNRLRDAFLAAKNGSEVDEIIKGVLSNDERIKIGRRILIAECLKLEMNVEEICQALRVGKSTVISVTKSLAVYPSAFKLIDKRKTSVEKTYNKKKYRTSGGSKLVFKKKEYTGFSRKNVKR